MKPKCDSKDYGPGSGHQFKLVCDEKGNADYWLCQLCGYRKGVMRPSKPESQ